MRTTMHTCDVCKRSGEYHQLPLAYLRLELTPPSQSPYCGETLWVAELCEACCLSLGIKEYKEMRDAKVMEEANRQMPEEKPTIEEIIRGLVQEELSQMVNG